MLRTAKNPWGQTLEAQRADLWHFYCPDLLAYLGRQNVQFWMAVGLDPRELPAQGQEKLLARSVVMPPLSVSPGVFISGTDKTSQPLYSEVPGIVQVTLRRNVQGSFAGADVMLEAWHQLVRVGRSTNVGKTFIPLPRATFRPSFKFNVQIELLKGVSEIPDTNGITQAAVQSAGFYTLTECWPTALIMDPVSNATAKVHEIQVHLQCSDIIPQ